MELLRGGSCHNYQPSTAPTPPIHKQNDKLLDATSDPFYSVISSQHHFTHSPHAGFDFQKKLFLIEDRSFAARIAHREAIPAIKHPGHLWQPLQAAEDDKALMERIAKEHGYLGEGKARPVRIETDPAARSRKPSLRRTLTIGSTVITPGWLPSLSRMPGEAEPINGSCDQQRIHTPAKLVSYFELSSRSADDNLYTPRTSGSVPCLSFERCIPTRSSSSATEDGFYKEENLEASLLCWQKLKDRRSRVHRREGGLVQVGLYGGWKAHIQSGLPFLLLLSATETENPVWG